MSVWKVGKDRSVWYLYKVLDHSKPVCAENIQKALGTYANKETAEKMAAILNEKEKPLRNGRSDKGHR